MGFQDVKLPSSLISEMYKSVLIEEPSAASPKFDSEPVQSIAVKAAVSSDNDDKPLLRPEQVLSGNESLKFLGGNSKNISLIASGKKVLAESAPETQFLLKILQACSLSMKDIALFDNTQIKKTLSEFITDQQPLKLLVFSKEINSDTIAPELLFQVRKEGNSEILYAPVVQDLMKDSAEAVQLKKRLWAALKNFFNV